jgi:hypothetical protein
MMAFAFVMEMGNWEIVKVKNRFQVVRGNDDDETHTVKYSTADEAKALEREDALSLDASLRAALRALADQFQDPVVRNAILWAANDGEKE